MGKKFFQTLSARKREPLILTAVTDNVLVKIDRTWEATVDDLFPPLLYRAWRGGSWGNVARYLCNTVIELNKGDKIQIWNQSEVFSINKEKSFGFGGVNNSDARMVVSGDLMALVNWRKDLPEYSFYQLFALYSPLLEAPEIPDVPMAENALAQAFFHCQNLNKIRVNFKEWSNATTDWMWDVTSVGTFYKPSALPEERGKSRIPNNWTVVNID